MGVDWTAFVEHTLDISGLRALPERLRREGPSLSAFVNDWLSCYLDDPNHDRTWTWDLPPGRSMEAEWTEHGEVRLEGPALLGLNFCRQVCEVLHPTRWAAFQTDPRTNRQLRRLCAQFAHLLGGRGAAYVPDIGRVFHVVELVHQGRPFLDIKEWLANECGPCVPAVGEAWRAGKAAKAKTTRRYWEAQTYAIEQFE